MALDLSKPLRWKCGTTCVPLRAVEVAPSRYIVVHDEIKIGVLCKVYSSGDLADELENVPERRTLSCWLNVYDHRIHNCTHSTKEVADRAAMSTRIACIHITQDYEVGEGLP